MKSFKIILFIYIFGSMYEVFSQNCTDISEDRKSSMLSEFEKYHRKYMGELLRAKTKPSERYVEPTDSLYYRDNTICDEEKNKKNDSLINKRSLCPWYTKIITREEWYPTLVKEVRCSCRWCNTKNAKPNSKWINGTYHCLPVMHPSVALKRGNCGRNNMWEWTPTIESFNVACVCSFRL
jgi:hypothetical protein